MSTRSMRLEGEHGRVSGDWLQAGRQMDSELAGERARVVNPYYRVMQNETTPSKLNVPAPAGQSLFAGFGGPTVALHGWCAS